MADIIGYLYTIPKFAHWFFWYIIKLYFIVAFIRMMFSCVKRKE